MTYGSKPSIDLGYNDFHQVSGAASLTWEYTYSPASYDVLSVDSRSGKSNPSWKRDIAAGRNATTTFTGVKQEYSVVPAHLQAFGSTTSSGPSGYRKMAKDYSYGITAIPNLPDLSLLADARWQAQTRFYKELQRTMTLFEGGVFLGELRETLHMIRNPAKSLRERLGIFINAAKKRRRGSPAAKKKVLADLWLEHAFGWAPLLNDLDTARQYHRKRTKQLAQELIRIKAYGKAEKVSFGNEGNISGSFQLFTYRRNVEKATVYYSGAVSSRALGSTIINRSAMGLSARSFVPTLWEILPWSFAIDYFTNIGDVLTAWSNQTADLAWGSQTERRESLIEGQGASWKPAAGIVRMFDSSLSVGACLVRHKGVGRKSITYVPVPSIRFEIPGFGRKWLNLAALVAARRSMSPY